MSFQQLREKEKNKQKQKTLVCLDGLVLFTRHLLSTILYRKRSTQVRWFVQYHRAPKWQTKIWRWHLTPMSGLLNNKPACFSNWPFQTRESLWARERTCSRRQVSTVYSQSYRCQRPEQRRIASFSSFLRVNGTMEMEQFQVVSLKLGQATEWVSDAT